MKDRRGLPRQPIFYTADQVAAFLNLGIKTLHKSYLWKVGVDRGVYRASYLRAVNLGSPKNPEVEDWRVAEGELIRWLRFHNLYLYDPDAIDADPEVLAEGYAPTHIRPYEPSVTPDPPTEEDVDADLVDF